MPSIDCAVRETGEDEFVLRRLGAAEKADDGKPASARWPSAACAITITRLPSRVFSWAARSRADDDADVAVVAQIAAGGDLRGQVRYLALGVRRDAQQGDRAACGIRSG